MKYLTAIGRALCAGGRAICSGLVCLVNMTSRQMQSLYSLALLGGIAIYSEINHRYILKVGEMVEDGDLNLTYFGMILEQMRFNSGIVALFALFVGLIVFGADYFSFKNGDAEASFGKRDDE